MTQVWRVISNPKLRKVKITERDLGMSILGLVLVDCAILLLWTAVDPYLAVRVPFEDDPRGIEGVKELVCASDGDTGSPAGSSYNGAHRLRTHSIRTF